MTAQPSIERLKRCVENHTFDSGDPDYKTVTNQLYRAYAESHEDNPLGIRKGFNESESFLEVLPLADKNAAFNICCRICVAYEHKAFKINHGAIKYYIPVSRTKNVSLYPL